MNDFTTSVRAGGDGGVQPVLSVAGITKRFGGITALDGVSFDAWAGEVHALMGENGAGKSTLMKILSGVHSLYEGAIYLNGAPVDFADVSEAEAAGIAIIHQELNLAPELSVAENIFLGREPLIAGLIVDKKACARAARDLLERLGIDLDSEARVGGLRIGEQQLVEIAKALSLSARILIMDEPTSALSPAECQRLFKIIRQLADDGVAIIYISHRIDEVIHLADRITVFRDGRHVVTEAMARMTAEKIIAAMVGRELMQSDEERSSVGKEVALSVSNLSLSLPTRQGWKSVLHGVNFDVHAGEILGIGGLLGAGRTEILQSIFGSTTGEVGGTVRLNGQQVSIRSPQDARRHGIALVTEDRKSEGLHLGASIVDNIALPLVGGLSRFGLRGFAGEEKLANHAVDSLAIRCSDIGQSVNTLSGGNQQKVVIGKWLATQPKVLLLDEPTRGIDVGAKREIYDLIFRLSADGLAIVVVTSELPELLHLADRILVMAEGRQTGTLSRAEATEDRIMQLASPRSAKFGRTVA